MLVRSSEQCSETSPNTIFLFFLLGFRVSCQPGLLAGYLFAVLFGGVCGQLAAWLYGMFAGLLIDGWMDARLAERSSTSPQGRFFFSLSTFSFRNRLNVLYNAYLPSPEVNN